MSMRARLTAAVNTAFDAVGNLAETATLSSKSVTGFNFATGVTESTSTNVTVTVIIMTENDPSGKSIILKALLKSGVDLTVYDTLTVGTKSYNITDNSDDGFTIYATIVREPLS